MSFRRLLTPRVSEMRLRFLSFYGPLSNLTLSTTSNTSLTIPGNLAFEDPHHAAFATHHKAWIVYVRIAAPWRSIVGSIQVTYGRERSAL